MLIYFVISFAERERQRDRETDRDRETERDLEGEYEDRRKES